MLAQLFHDDRYWHAGDTTPMPSTDADIGILKGCDTRAFLDEGGYLDYDRLAVQFYRD